MKEKDELRHLLRNRLQVIAGFAEGCAGHLMPMHIKKAFDKITKEIESLSEELGKYGL